MLAGLLGLTSTLDEDLMMMMIVFCPEPGGSRSHKLLSKDAPVSP